MSKFNYISAYLPYSGGQQFCNSYTSYAPIALFNSSDNMLYKILPSNVEIQSLDNMNANIELLTLPEILYPEELDNTENSFLDLYTQQTSLTFKSFFAYQHIDIPLCFAKSKSLYRDYNFNLSTRLVNVVSRHGRRPYVVTTYSKVAIEILSKLNETDESISQRKYEFWNHLLITLTSSTYEITKLSYRLKNFSGLKITGLGGEKFTRSHFTTRYEDALNTLLAHSLEPYLPAFGFFIRKVDKLKRKHSRGKTGKHEIIWKYIPEYKRYWTVIRWLSRDIKFQKARTLKTRMLNSLEVLFFSKNNHLIYKFRQFVHRFVFENYKKTLLRTLRSTS